MKRKPPAINWTLVLVAAAPALITALGQIVATLIQKLP